MRYFAAFVGALLLISLSPSALGQAKHDRQEAVLADLDARQKDMVARADVDGLAALSSAGLTINAPINRVLTRDQFLTMMRSGKIGAEAFERHVESISVHGDLGIVMGSEVFTPTAESELGRTYGVTPLRRRYTNVYVLEQGQWKWFARHANVIAGASSSVR